MRAILWSSALLFVMFAGGLLLPPVAFAQWTLFEETNVAGTISGAIKHGHVFKTLSGHFYEVVDYVYLYEYEYSPSVIVLTDGSSYKLHIEGFDESLLCKCLNCGPQNATPEQDYNSRELTIKAIQVALAVLGFYSGNAEGVLDLETEAAAQKFCSVSGFAPIDSLNSAVILEIGYTVAKKYPSNSEALQLAHYLVEIAPRWPIAPSLPNRSPQASPTPQVIESRILGEFNGLDYGNIYKLMNGQIWEQSEPWIWIWIWMSPKVFIWNDDGVYRMKVENIDHAVMVRRIQ